MYENTAQYMTLASLLAQSESKGNVIERKTQKVSTVAPNYPRFEPDKSVKQLTVEEVKDMMVRGHFEPVASLVVGKGKLFKYIPQLQQTQPCDDLYKRLFVINKDYLQDAADKVGTNGTLQGAITRRLETTPSGVLKFSLTALEKKLIDNELPNVIQVRKVEVAGQWGEELLKCAVNVKAAAGFPEMLTDNFATVETYSKQIFARAESYMAELREAQGKTSVVVANFLNNLLHNRPAEVTLQWKRKLDRYLRTDYYKKARTYFVYPAALKFVMLPAARIIRESCVKFDDSDAVRTNGSAYGFSWIGGGAGKLIHWIEDTREGEFRSIFYGDDAIWVMRYKSKLYIMCPDFTGMDNTISDEIKKYAISLFAGVSRERWFLQTLLILVTTAFNMHAHVAYALVYRFLKGMHSGHPSTTVLDNIMSGIASILIKYKVEDLIKKGDPLSFNFVDYLKDKLNLRIKASTYGWKVYTLPSDMPPFLGMTLKKYNENWYPVREISDIATSLVIPRTIAADKNQVTRTMERVAGCYITGSWYYDDLYKLSHEYFKTHMATTRPAFTTDEENILMPSTRDIMTDGSAYYTTLPSKEAMCVLFDSGTDAYHEYRRSTSESVKLKEEKDDIDDVVTKPTSFDVPDLLEDIEPMLAKDELVVKKSKQDKYGARTRQKDKLKHEAHNAKLENWARLKAARRAKMDEIKGKKGRERHKAEAAYFDEQYGIYDVTENENVEYGDLIEEEYTAYVKMFEQEARNIESKSRERDSDDEDGVVDDDVDDNLDLLDSELDEYLGAGTGGIDPSTLQHDLSVYATTSQKKWKPKKKGIG